MALTYHRVDVFTDRPFGGNQLAVFTDADGVAPDIMQKIGNEFNLPEITFVLPPEDDQSDYRVRIFTPQRELPMAGHPTVGTAFVLHHLGMVEAPGQVTFGEGVGAIPVSLSNADDNTLQVKMTQPLPEFGAIYEDNQVIADMLALSQDDLLTDYPIQVVSTGVPFLYIPVKSLAAMREMTLQPHVWTRFKDQLGSSELFVFSPETENADATVHSRMFAPAFGIPEDPATGAASGPLGAYLVHYGLVKPENADRIVSEQGIEMGRPSTIHIEIDLTGTTISGVRIGGQSVYLGSGQLVVSQ